MPTRKELAREKAEQYAAMVPRLTELAANPHVTQEMAARELEISEPTIRRIATKHSIVWVTHRGDRTGRNREFTEALKALAGDPEVSLRKAAATLHVSVRTLKLELNNRKIPWQGDATVTDKPSVSGRKSKKLRRSTWELAHELNSIAMPWLPD